MANRRETFSSSDNSIIADITENIAGDRIDLHSIAPVGRDPHEYEPLVEDVRKATDADLILYNGLNLETGGNGWFTKLMNTNKVEMKITFAVSDGVDVLYLSDDEDHSKADPHAWLNLENGMIYARNIAQRLSEGPWQSLFLWRKTLNATCFIRRTGSASEGKLPIDSRREEIDRHQWGSLQILPKPTVYRLLKSTEEEGTPAQIKNLVDQLQNSAVASLFVEKRQYSSDAKCFSWCRYSDIRTVFTDSIAEPGEEGDSYYNMMKWNLDYFIRAWIIMQKHP